MDTLPDDLLGLIAKHDLPTIQSIFPTNQSINRIVENYMNAAYNRLMNDLSRLVSSDVLTVIRNHNITISGSFVLRAICNQYTNWYSDLDLIINERDLIPEIVSVLDVKESEEWNQSSMGKMYDGFGRIKKVLRRDRRENDLWIDLIIIENEGTVSDLLSSYDYDFVRNSLKFLADRSAGLEIYSPSAVFNRKCVVNLKNYGIDKLNNSAMQYVARTLRLLMRAIKYKNRGFSLSVDKEEFNKILGDEHSKRFLQSHLKNISPELKLSDIFTN